MSAPHRPAAGPDTAAGRLRARLEQLRALALDRSFTHPAFADLVLAHGRDYAPALWPAAAQAHPQRAGDCFAGAHEWADDEGWTYCGGYALAAADPVIGAFEHAWCLIPEGRAADPAVPDGRVLAYRGLPLTDAFRRAQGRGGHAVITFGRDLLTGPNLDVLRGGLPPDALAAGTPDTAEASGRRPRTAHEEG
ncbi:hypothetical protein [Streptomyces sp. NPDC088812]|uniref:hypothetical protein n=1 Tax=Streptomyces sp. NPDC088812 TaxID=3365905 RepID=UPI00382B8123